MARLSVITDEISEDLETALDVCADLGISDIELRSVWGTSIVEYDDVKIRKIADAVWSRGFSVCGIASPFLKCHIDGESGATGRTHSARTSNRSDQWDILSRSLEIAVRLDAPIVRAFSFWRVDDPLTVRDEVLDVLHQATKRVKSAGRLLGMENEYSCNIATGEEAAWFLERIPDLTFGLIWDPGNTAALGIAPMPDDYMAVRGRIHHVHIKDAVRLGEPVEFTEIGNGVIGYEEQFRLLAEDGYDGVISLETHFDQDGGRESATRACASATREIASSAGLHLT